jgi:hypothetical protein
LDPLLVVLRESVVPDIYIPPIKSKLTLGPKAYMCDPTCTGVRPLSCSWIEVQLWAQYQISPMLEHSGGKDAVTRSSLKDDHTCEAFGLRVMIAGMGQCVLCIYAGVRHLSKQVHTQQFCPKSRSCSTLQSLLYQKYQASPSRPHGKVYSIHSRITATGMRCHGCSCALHRVQGEQALHNHQAVGGSASLLGAGFEWHT